MWIQINYIRYQKNVTCVLFRYSYCCCFFAGLFSMPFKFVLGTDALLLATLRLDENALSTKNVDTKWKMLSSTTTLSDVVSDVVLPTYGAAVFGFHGNCPYLCTNDIVWSSFCVFSFSIQPPMEILSLRIQMTLYRPYLWRPWYPLWVYQTMAQLGEEWKTFNCDGAL